MKLLTKTPIIALDKHIFISLQMKGDGIVH